MLKKRYLFLIIIVCLFSISTVSAQDNSTGDIVSVSNDVNSLEANIEESNMNSIANGTDTLKVSNDELLTAVNHIWYVNGSQAGGDGKTPESAFKTLNDAIQSCGDGDTIMIASGLYAGSGINVNLETSKKLNLIKYGDGEAIFDGQGNTRIFNIMASCFNITGLTFKNGKSDDGGALHFKNSGVDLKYNINAIFINNTATRFGGAVYVDADIIYSNINGTYIGNEAQCGGANYFEGSVKFSNIKGTYTYNRAEDGGANEFYGYIRYSHISGRYINNTASDGSILSFFNNPTDTTIENAVFLNNNYDENKTVIYSRISGLTADNNWFGNNASNYLVKPNVSNTITMYRWLFLDGTAASGKFSFFLMKYDDMDKIISQYDNTLVGKINLTITAINATIGKDYVLLKEEISYEYIYSHEFIIAQFENAKYVIEFKLGDFNLLQELINQAAANSVINLPRDYTYDEYDYRVNGVSINKIITINGNGHSIDAKEKARIFQVNSQSINIINITLKNGKAEYGGGIYFSQPISNSYINATYINNTATKFGGANYFFGRVSNSVINGTYISNKAGLCGGANYFAIEIMNSNINGTYISNKAGSYGGANGFNNYIENLIINATYINNEATCGGANGFNNDYIKNMTITGLYIKNTAKDYGGANYFSKSVSGITVNGTYINNTSTKFGGANHFYKSIADVIITGVYINNTANNYGGANCFEDTVTNSNITGTYINNKASTADGGANHFYKNILNMIINGTYINNFAEWHGGANSFDTNVTNSTIIGLYINNTSSRGGAFYFKREVSRLNMTGLFINNTATVNGIIFFNGALSDVNISSAIFLNNKGGTEIYAGNNGAVANNNWFGNNATNYNDSPNVSPSIAVNTWLFLNATANKTSLLSTLDILFKLYSYNSGEISEYDNSKLPIVNLTLISTKGNVDKDIINLDEIVKYEANSPGQGSVTAIVENVECTILFINDKINANLSVEDVEVPYGENIILNLNYNNNATGTVNITINGEKYNKTFESIDLNKTFALQDIILPGEYNVTVIYSGDETFSNGIANAGLTVKRLKSDIKVVSHDIYFNNTCGLMFTVTLPENATGNLTISNGSTINVSKEGKKENNSLIVEILNNAYSVGQYNWTFTYLGDDIYENSAANATSNILPIETKITANTTSELFIDDTSQVYYNLTPGDAVGTVKFESNDTNVVKVDLHSGEITAIAEGSALITVTFEGSENYTASSTNVSMTVSKIPTEITVENDTLELIIGDVVDSGATLTPADVGNLTYTSSNETVVMVENGKIKALAEGNVIITVSFAGDDKYAASEANIVVIVNPVPVPTKENLTLEVTAEPITVGDNANVVVTGLKNATGEISVTIGINKWTGKINKGTANVVVTGLKESVTAGVNYHGDEKYNPASSTVKITVNPNVIIDAPDVTKYYGGSERFAVSLKDLNDNPIVNADIKISINGQTYTKTTDNNGETSIAINLNSGVYNVKTEYNGTKVYSTVTVKDTVIAKDVTKIFRNGTQYQGIFVDSKGNLVKNTDVEININGVFYTRTTDANGMAQMNINLPPGTYILTATNPSTGEMHTTNVTVLPNIVENHDLTKYYRNASQYSLRLLDDKGNPVGAGVSIKLNINGVFYTRTSDENGYVKMNINLPPGTYIITAEYKGLRMSNTINVLSVLETEDLVMKYHDESQFKAKVLDGQGKPYVGQTVTYNINGVFYTKTTGDDGIAGLTINLPAGEYIITSMYNGLNAANKITITS